MTALILCREGDHHTVNVRENRGPGELQVDRMPSFSAKGNTQLATMPVIGSGSRTHHGVLLRLLRRSKYVLAYLPDAIGIGHCAASWEDLLAARYYEFRLYNRYIKDVKYNEALHVYLYVC